MEKLQRLILLLQGYITKKWFGQIVISFENGNIVNLKVTENIKL
jgi:hypothetical protein